MIANGHTPGDMSLAVPTIIDGKSVKIAVVDLDSRANQAALAYFYGRTLSNRTKTIIDMGASTDFDL